MVSANSPLITEMTIEEKVGQILMVFFKGNEINSEAEKLFEQAHVGNIIYYKWANGLYNPQHVQQLSNDLQQLASKQPHAIPLFIAVDQEGGRVNRLTDGFTLFPSNGEVGKSSNPELAKSIAKAIGAELRAVGVNMNLAPVVDINSNPSRTVMNDRSFGDSVEKVTEFGRNALEGYRESNIVATLKHFPGYGEAAVDPHVGLPVVNKSRDELMKMELAPFSALSNQADAIMTAHILMPALDEINCATFSKKIIQGILREEFGYSGLIISDSLVMNALLNLCESIEEAAVLAFEAGHDILIFGGKLLINADDKDLKADDIVRIHHAIVDAVKSGRISQSRLDDSVERILITKKKINHKEHEEHKEIK